VREATIYRWSLGFGVVAYLTSLTAWLSWAVKVSFSLRRPSKSLCLRQGSRKALRVAKLLPTREAASLSATKALLTQGAFLSVFMGCVVGADCSLTNGN
jgi:hypothetical protein